MRIFRTFLEAHNELERELKHNGVVYQTQTVQDKDVRNDEGFKTKELLGYSFLVKDPNIKEFIDSLNLNTEWIDQEFTERISGLRLNPGEAYKLRQVWEEFVHDGKFSYTYSDRIADQVKQVIDLLKTTPASRHAIISIYQPEIDNNRRDGKMRVPCTMYYNFMIRPTGEASSALHMIYNIRSNDFSTHFPYDLILARMLQEYIASELEIQPGDFIYQGGSFHVFYKDNKEIF